MIPPKGDLVNIVSTRLGLPKFDFVDTGYLHFVWRDNGLVSGFVMLIDGDITGAYVEFVTSNKEITGDAALAEIVEALNLKKIKAIEIYTSPKKVLLEYLRAFPEVQCKKGMIKIERDFDSVEEFIEFLKGFTGTLVLENSTHQWILNTDKGIILRAVEYSQDGNVKYGDDAVNSLMHEIPKYLPTLKVEEVHGKYQSAELKQTSCLCNGLLEVLSLLILKNHLERGTL